MMSTPVSHEPLSGSVRKDDSELLLARVRVAVAERYDGLREIGRGGMAVVYAARDRKLNRDIALKVLPPDLGFRNDVKERFVREAQTAARLNHPGIVPIYAVDEADGLVYFVMALVQGESLAARLARESRPPLSFVSNVLAQVADALAYAHRSGVIHRDIKPDNILLEHATGRAIVTDFGIARAVQSGARLTQTGIAVGTPAFMSPEQAMGQREIDGRSDVYGLGVVGYVMLTGRLPFDAQTSAGMLVQHVQGTPFPLANFRPDLPFSITDAITRAIAREPSQRWPDAASLAAALRAGHEQEREEERRRADDVRDRGERLRGLPINVNAGAQNVGERRNAGARSREPVVADAAVANVGDGQTVNRRIRRFRVQVLQALLIMGLLLFINASVGGPPWFVFPWIGILLGLLGTYMKLGDHDIGLRDVLRGPGANAIAPQLSQASRAERARKVLTEFKRRAKWVGASLAVLAGGFIGLVATQGEPPMVVTMVGGGALLLINGALFVRDSMRLRDVGLTVRDALGESWQDKIAAMDDLPRTVRLSQRAESLADADVLRSPHGRVLREAVDDAATIQETWSRLDPADRELVQDVGPTADALLERVSSLVTNLARLDGVVEGNAMPSLETRIAALETQGELTAEAGRRLSLLKRQHASLTELVQRQDVLQRQLESASLALRALRLDVVKLRALGVGAAIGDVSSATQEARAISADIGRALDVADELRRL